MKTLLEIQNEVAAKFNFASWEAFIQIEVPYKKYQAWEEVCRRAQLECASETLKEASKNAKKGFNDIDRSSITDKANIKLIQ